MKEIQVVLLMGEKLSIMEVIAAVCSGYVNPPTFDVEIQWS